MTRAWGSGTVFRRGDGRWCGKLQMPGSQPKYVYGRTRKDVEQKLDDARRRLGLGLPILTDRYTLAEFLGTWLDEIVSTGRESTYAIYRQRLESHVLPRIGQVPLTRLAPQHVQSMMADALAGGLSPRTVRELRGVLRAALNVALRWGYVERNVAALAEPPKVEPYQARSLTASEALRFLEHVRGHRLESLFVLSLGLGLRQGELLGLRWDDVDLDAASLHVRVQLQQVKGKPQLVELKTKASRRPLSLPAFIVRSLRDHRTRQLQQRLQAGTSWQEWGLVFPSSVGTPLSARNLDREFYAVRAELGLDTLRFHDLRHSAGTMLRLQGVSMKTTQLILGHASYHTTADTYSHVLPDEIVDAARRLDLLFGAS